MKYILITLLMLSFPTDPLKIGKINSVKSQARKAYTSGDYKTAIAKYRYLIDSLQVNEDEVMLNLANAYYQSSDTANAFSTYQSLTGSTKNVVRSKAQQQIGVMNHQKGKLEEALNNFKQAIKADPNNIDARYNYELLKKKLDEKKKQEQQKQDQNKDKKDQNKDQKKDQEKKDQEKKDQEQKDQEKKDQEKKDQEQKNQQNKDQKDKKDQEQKKEDAKKDQQNKEQQDQQNKDDEQNADKKEQQQNVSKKLEQMKISKEKANALLEAMKNQEVQYLQENKRKATKPKDRTKPDW